MASRFFFHSPDGRIYGPADLATLQRWRAEGRVRDDSEIREEREGPRTTFAEVAARQPEPEPAPAAATPPVLPPPAPAAAFTPATLWELLSRAMRLYARGFAFFWPVAAVIQLPLLAFYLIALQGIKASEDYTKLPDLPNLSAESHQGLHFFLLFIALCATNAVGSGLLAAAAARLEKAGRVDARGVWHAFTERVPALTKTWVLGSFILSAWVILALFLCSILFRLPFAARFETPLLFLSLFPALLFQLRYLLAAQIVVLEKREGLVALKRSNDLVRLRVADATVGPGDFRLLVLLAASAFVFVIATRFLSLTIPLFPDRLLSVALSVVFYLGAATATPFLAIVLTLFALDARKRLPESAWLDRPPAKKE